MSKRWLIASLFALIVFSGCVAPEAFEALATQTAEQAAVETIGDGDGELSPAHRTALARINDQGPAPELHNEIWINSEPLRLEDLRGNVVIVEFWTYG